MPISLDSFAEDQARRAEKLAAFGGVNLSHIKRQLAELLKLIGRNGIFDEYTLHDITHIDKMLEVLGWLVPEETKRIMSPADWLLAVLGIYFHDVGMLVTTEEYARRSSSGFRRFTEEVLFSGEQGEEYRHKIDALNDHEKERFLYQEFVRYHHAERVAFWIRGEAPQKLGITDAAAAEIDRLLSPLTTQFRRDLAFVAESHHLDDLDDLKKYRVSQPYGDTETETSNIQYAAILLRASDLLHMTGDRTPAIAFRLINPVDPLSQQEWAKQTAVTCVRSRIGFDSDGNPDPELPRDSIEVHAFFDKEDGFFGLTSYLSYAAQQLSKCHDWIAATYRRKLARHNFPWSKIDDSNIETHGFIRDAFQFTIDQARILDLLTGHTLYNDSSVVLRELVQNALDTVRLRLYESSNSPPGMVKISWDSDARILTVTDNGCGMTQETISQHLLRVGASLYQEPSFKKAHPGFTSISRFGIGVLSTFMIADSVDIITCHPEEDKARRLALRSVHGKYLISLLDKEDEAVKPIGAHGTSLRLRLRQTVELPDFVSIARHWILIPNCRVCLAVDGKDPIEIGFSSPKDVMEWYLKSTGHKVVDDAAEPHARNEDQCVRVIQREQEGVTIAYAVRWSPWFHEWSFMPNTAISQGAIAPSPLGTCVEGIRIDSCTPGFSGRKGILALANARGERAPKTNVARSGLEATPEREGLLRAVYRAYSQHAEEEIKHLIENRGHSLTWAVAEAQYLLSALTHTRGREEADVLNERLFLDALGEVRLHLLETAAGREAISSWSLTDIKQFWTVTCPLFRSAEALIREIPGNVSIRSLVSTLGSSVEFPDEPILCQTGAYTNRFEWMAFKGREITRIVARKASRRLDFLWEPLGDPPRWLSLPPQWSGWCQRMSEQHRRPFAQYPTECVLLQGNVELDGLAGEVAVRHEGKAYIFGDSPAITYVSELLKKELAAGNYDDRLPPVVGLLALFCQLLSRRALDDIEQFVHRVWGAFLSELPSVNAQEDEWNRQLRDAKLLDVIVQSQWIMFDPERWNSREDEW